MTCKRNENLVFSSCLTCFFRWLAPALNVSSVYSAFSETAIDAVINKYKNKDANNNRCIGENEGQFIETNIQVD